MKGTYGVKHFGGRIMPQELSTKYQSNVDFCAESIGAIFLVGISMLEGYFNGEVKKTSF
jgi:hypothetical protein